MKGLDERFSVQYFSTSVLVPGLRTPHERQFPAWGRGNDMRMDCRLGTVAKTVAKGNLSADKQSTVLELREDAIYSYKRTNVPSTDISLYSTQSYT